MNQCFYNSSDNFKANSHFIFACSTQTGIQSIARHQECYWRGSCPNSKFWCSTGQHFTILGHDDHLSLCVPYRLPLVHHPRWEKWLKPIIYIQRVSDCDYIHFSLLDFLTVNGLNDIEVSLSSHITILIYFYIKCAHFNKSQTLVFLFDFFLMD